MPEKFSSQDARRIGEQLGVDWAKSAFDVEQFRMGLEVELEHGAKDASTNVTNDDPILTGKIALASFAFATSNTESHVPRGDRRPGSC